MTCGGVGRSEYVGRFLCKDVRGLWHSGRLFYQVARCERIYSARKALGIPRGTSG
jgi:hypothetical protein